MRAFLLILSLLAAAPAAAQIRLGETGLSLTATGTAASDYLFRGISQTRSRPAWQGVAELSHPGSGVYIGGFLSNVNFLGYDAVMELDLYAGARFRLAGFAVDVSAIWYHYAGFTRRGGQARLDYAEGVLRVSRAIGPVTPYAVLVGSPNYFTSSGTGIYVEAGADWQTGWQGINLGARLGYQWIQREASFGTPDYAWWGLVASREFTVSGIGTAIATLGYYQTSVARADCVPVGGRGQDICGARALGSVAFRF